MLDQIMQDIKQAMKDKDNFKRDTLRFLHSAIKQVQIDTRQDLDEENIVKLIQKQIKQREDAITQYQEADRQDLVHKEQQEIDILKPYLPKQLDDEALKDIIKNIMQNTNATSMKDMGKVMSEAKNTIGAKADGKRINAMVKVLLG